MKLSHLSSELLKFMVESYSQNHNSTFSIDAFRDLYPDLDDDFISDALYLLRDDGLVNVLRSDGVADITTILPVAIRDMEEDTFFKKGYKYLKEIRSWL